ncbi:NEDD4-like E3 ubiquitin-protein ligase WWP2 [Chelonia mydas]|uniref:NEDD4-like E3 ubiquitin-protein ligase WWP2 n=1 Tax=Chelonia mydas TaxID=8469 RepID=M7B8B0_CHEMY|nr:NEDD4-like E3 ubiquitin-protein ligase WWP2 [Chelonia mydas]
MVDGLPSETKKTGKRIGSSELLWNEILLMNVTAQSHLDLKVWSCHTLRNELLGTASISLCNVLKKNGGKMENMQLTLNLQTENKGSVVSGGELTIFLDGPTVDLGSLPNGSAVTEGSQLPGRDPSSVAPATESRHQPPSTNCFGGRSRFRVAPVRESQGDELREAGDPGKGQKGSDKAESSSAGAYPPGSAFEKGTQVSTGKLSGESVAQGTMPQGSPALQNSRPRAVSSTTARTQGLIPGQRTVGSSHTRTHRNSAGAARQNAGNGDHSPSTRVRHRQQVKSASTANGTVNGDSAGATDTEEERSVVGVTSPPAAVSNETPTLPAPSVPGEPEEPAPASGTQSPRPAAQALEALPPGQLEKASALKKVFIPAGAGASHCSFWSD